MPKIIDWEAIYRHWKKTGANSSAIARKFGISKRAVDERIPQWRASSDAPANKIVQLQAQQRPPVTPAVAVRRAEQSDDLTIVGNAIQDVAAALGKAANGEDLRSLGGIATGLVRLIELKLKLQPRTAAELAEVAISQGVRPEDFLKALKDQWQLRA